ncbi:hypothetical protein BCR36DRAFT_394631 [Piromyces finnis]|uniref:PIG-F-domain-containing protein n=1 Tax=Piromyces finnis TaxID=1754191 RepID=A0A1Y1VL89_9FUNG|nr:hypothetical protein BCR36DRAFT_394631 [Piromyces finnis]|eukprot:ORX59063.1 hypothetical protein BCR36DRAFT_394631 [Piromyces finnis]
MANNQKNENKKKTAEFKFIKSKFDLVTLLILPFTSATICLFSKESLTNNTALTIFTAALMSFVARTGLMYWANAKRKASPRRQFVAILTALIISIVFSVFTTIFCLLVKVSLSNKLLELISCSIFIAVLGMYPAAFVVSTDIDSWTRMFSLIEIFKCDKHEISVGAPLLGSIIGAWASTLALPLDWNAWWQPFPISTVICSVLGNIIGSIIGIIFYLFKKEKIPKSSNKKEQ